MVYNFLGIDKKTKRKLLTFYQNVHTVYWNVRAVYPSKNHVTTRAPCDLISCIMIANSSKDIKILTEQVLSTDGQKDR